MPPSKEFKKLFKICNPFIFYSEQFEAKYFNPSHKFLDTPIQFKITDALSLPSKYNVKKFIEEAIEVISEIYKRISNNYPDLFQQIFVDAPLQLIDTIYDFLFKAKNKLWNFLETSTATLTLVVENMIEFAERLFGTSGSILKQIFKTLDSSFSIANRVFASLSGYFLYISNDVTSNFVQGLNGLYDFFVRFFLPWKTAKSSILTSALLHVSNIYGLIGGNENSAISRILGTKNKELYVENIFLGTIDSPLVLQMGKCAYQFCALNDMWNFYGQLDDFVLKTNQPLTEAFAKLFINFLKANQDLFETLNLHFPNKTAVPKELAELLRKLTRLEMIFNGATAFQSIPALLIDMIGDALENNHFLEVQVIIQSMIKIWSGMFYDTARVLYCFLTDYTDLAKSFPLTALQYNLHNVDFPNLKQNVQESFNIYKRLIAPIDDDNDKDVVELTHSIEVKTKEIGVALNSLDHLKVVNLLSHHSISHIVFDEGMASLSLFEKASSSILELVDAFVPFMELRDKKYLPQIGEILGIPSLEDATSLMRMAFVMPSYHDYEASRITGNTLSAMVTRKVEEQKTKQLTESFVEARISNVREAPSHNEPPQSFTDLLDIIFKSDNLIDLPVWRELNVSKITNTMNQIDNYSNSIEAIKNNIKSKTLKSKFDTLRTELFNKQRNLFFDGLQARNFDDTVITTNYIPPFNNETTLADTITLFLEFDLLDLDNYFGVENNNDENNVSTTTEENEKVVVLSTEIMEKVIIHNFNTLVTSLLQPQIILMRSIITESAYKTVIGEFFEQNDTNIDIARINMIHTFMKAILIPFYLSLIELGKVIDNFSRKELLSAIHFDKVVKLEEMSIYASLVETPYKTVFFSLFNEFNPTDMTACTEIIDQTMAGLSEKGNDAPGTPTLALNNNLKEAEKAIFLEKIYNNKYFVLSARNKALQLLESMCECVTDVIHSQKFEADFPFIKSNRDFGDSFLLRQDDLKPSLTQTKRLLYVINNKIFFMFKTFFAYDRITTNELTVAWKYTFQAILDGQYTQRFLIQERRKATAILLFSIAGGIYGLGMVAHYGIIPQLGEMATGLLATRAGIEFVELVATSSSSIKRTAIGVYDYVSGWWGSNKQSAPIGTLLKVWQPNEKTIEEARTDFSSVYHLIKGAYNRVTLVNTRSDDYIRIIERTDVGDDEINRFVKFFEQGVDTEHKTTLSFFPTPSDKIIASDGNIIKFMPELFADINKMPKINLKLGWNASPSVELGNGNKLEIKTDFEDKSEYLSVHSEPFFFDTDAPNTSESQSNETSETNEAITTDVILPAIIKLPSPHELFTSALKNKGKFEKVRGFLKKMLGFSDETPVFTTFPNKNGPVLSGVDKIPYYPITNINSNITENITGTFAQKHAEYFNKVVTPEELAEYLFLQDLDNVKRVVPFSEIPPEYLTDEVLTNEQFGNLLSSLNTKYHGVLYVPGSYPRESYAKVLDLHATSLKEIYKKGFEKELKNFPFSASTNRIRDYIYKYEEPSLYKWSRDITSNIVSNTLEMWNSPSTYITENPLTSLLVIPVTLAFSIGFGTTLAILSGSVLVELLTKFINRNNKTARRKRLFNVDIMDDVRKDFELKVFGSRAISMYRENGTLTIEDGETKTLYDKVKQIQRHFDRMAIIGKFSFKTGFSLSFSVGAANFMVSSAFAFFLKYFKNIAVVLGSIMQFVVNILTRTWQKADAAMANPISFYAANSVLPAVISATTGWFSGIAGGFVNQIPVIGETLSKFTSFIAGGASSVLSTAARDKLLGLRDYTHNIPFAEKFVQYAGSTSIINSFFDQYLTVENASFAFNFAKTINDKYNIIGKAWGFLGIIRRGIAYILSPITKFFENNLLVNVQELNNELNKIFQEITEKIIAFNLVGLDSYNTQPVKEYSIQTANTSGILKTQSRYFQIPTFINFLNMKIEFGEMTPLILLGPKFERDQLSEGIKSLAKADKDNYTAYETFYRAQIDLNPTLDF